VQKHNRPSFGLLGLAASAVLISACSLLLDRSDQCQTDQDCVAFGNHPVCRGGFCASSGLGPPGCYFGTPQNQTQFANACSVSDTVPFDNCARLGLCQNTGGTIPETLVLPANLGSVPALVNPQPPPTMPCEHPSRPNVIFATGSTNLLPLLKAVAPLLAADDPPFTVVYQPQTSCKGAGSMFEADPAKRVIKDIPNNWAFFYDPAGGKNYCLLNAAGNPVDIGESDVYARTCGYDTKAEVADYPGPIQAITFVVPAASSQMSISAEAAHFLFGAGGNMGLVPPWTDPRLYFVRSSGTGTVQLVSRAINVPAASWWGIDRLSSDNLRDSMVAIDPTQAEKAIGVLSSDFADQARSNLRVLAFQAAGQSVGYLPDSDLRSKDKINVRDGHYPIWGPIHLYAATTNGVPSRAADALVRRFSVPRLEQKLLEAIVASGYIPACAMRVRRDQEMGPMASHQPQVGCGCFFEAQVNGAASCQKCANNSDCPKSRSFCNYGYCEVL
jgi:ABC-type phosphate transport system substrate-binding protein